MAGNRLALAGCKEATEGPWILAKGNEKHVKIMGLEDGEYVTIEIESRDNRVVSVVHNQPGVFPFPQVVTKKYRAIKQIIGSRVSCTHVEIITGDSNG